MSAADGRKKQKSPEKPHSSGDSVQWTEPGSNRRPKDFQAILTPICHCRKSLENTGFSSILLTPSGIYKHFRAIARIAENSRYFGRVGFSKNGNYRFSCAVRRGNGPAQLRLCAGLVERHPNVKSVGEQRRCVLSDLLRSGRENRRRHPSWLGQMVRCRTLSVAQRFPAAGHCYRELKARCHS